MELVLMHTIILATISLAITGMMLLSYLFTQTVAKQIRYRRRRKYFSIDRSIYSRYVDGDLRRIEGLINEWEIEREERLQHVMRHHFLYDIERQPREKVNWPKEGF